MGFTYCVVHIVQVQKQTENLKDDINTWTYKIHSTHVKVIFPFFTKAWQQKLTPGQPQMSVNLPPPDVSYVHCGHL